MIRPGIYHHRLNRPASQHARRYRICEDFWDSAAAPHWEGQAMSRSKRLLVLVLIVFIIAGILWAAARLYLSSEQVTTQVSSRLQALYGAPIQIRQADVGVLGSSLRDLRVFENKTSPTDEPWLVIEHVEADVPLWDLAKKKA